MLRDLRYLASKRGAWPVYAVVFVTERCPARCGHCLVGDARYAGEELTLGDYARLARTMRPLSFLLITGGEPFVRADIAEIAGAFIGGCGARSVGIPTNGAFPEEAERAVREMVKAHPSVQFGVDVSIDGVGAEHDALRGAPGLFDSAVETYGRLARVAAGVSNLNLNVALTLSAGNQEKAEGLIKYLFGNLGVRNVNLLLTRGNPRDPESVKVSPENYERAARLLEVEMEARGGGWKGYPEARVINAMRRVRTRVIAETVRSGKFQIPCYAARLGVVVRANGDVTACELRGGVLGNVWEAGFDFGAIWQGEAARAERGKIKNEKCFCTYECFQTINILYNPSMLPAVGREMLRARRGGGE